MTAKAFGRFEIRKPLPLRAFERYFGIKARKGPLAWRSSYTSIQNLLDHLYRYTRSEGSRESYLNMLKRFSLTVGYNPDELVQFPKSQIESFIQEYADDRAKKNASRAYVNTIIKRLRTFFILNEYPNLELHRYYQPTRYRKRPEYIPTKSEIYSMANATGSTRDRAIILVLWSSGLRVSTLCALNYGDLSEDLEKGEIHILIPVYPEMKKRVPDACKGEIPYSSFICSEAGEALRVYLREREIEFGSLSLHDPLFHSDWKLWNRSERSSKRLGRRGIGLIVKKAAKLSGLKQWRDVTPHCLRKAFESILRSPTIDGSRLDKGTQEFLFGHILPGSQDTYYDKTKMDFHRREYAKLDFSISGVPARTFDKLINLGELESHFEDGWMFVARISDQSVVVRRVV